MVKKIKKVIKAAKQPKNIKQAPKSTLPGNKADRLEKHKWKKGCPSPNPSGRPKGALCLTTALRTLLSQKGKSKKEKYKELIEKLFTEAKDGNAKLIQLIFDRVDGKLADHVITSETGPLEELDEEKLNDIINAGRNQPSDPE